MKADPATAATVPRALGRLRVALDAAYVQSSRELGLTAQQAELLCAAMSPTPVGELARALRCDRSNISHLVERAQKRGLVRRGSEAADGRVTLIELTPEGSQLASQFLATLESRTAGLLAAWPRERHETASLILGEIAEALEDPRRRSSSHDGHPIDSQGLGQTLRAVEPGGEIRPHVAVDLRDPMTLHGQHHQSD